MYDFIAGHHRLVDFAHIRTCLLEGVCLCFCNACMHVLSLPYHRPFPEIVLELHLVPISILEQLEDLRLCMHALAHVVLEPLCVTPHAALGHPGETLGAAGCFISACMHACIDVLTVCCSAECRPSWHVSAPCAVVMERDVTTRARDC